MRELDVLLERFAREAYPRAHAGWQAAFERLLEQPDPELAAWLLGRAAPADRELALLVSHIARHGGRAPPPGPPCSAPGTLPDCRPDP